MENVTNQEKGKLIDDIKAKAQNILSQIPEAEMSEGPIRSVTIEVEPVVPDSNNLIATADIINIGIDNEGNINHIRSQTSVIDMGIEYVRRIFLNAPGGPYIWERNHDKSQSRNNPALSEINTFEALANGRYASVSELNQLNTLLSRAQKGFRIFRQNKS